MENAGEKGEAPELDAMLVANRPWHIFDVELPQGPDWRGCDFYVFSVWGNGNQGKDHWGYPKHAAMRVATPSQIDGKWYVTVYLDNETGGGPPNGHYLGFIARGRLINGDIVTVGGQHQIRRSSKSDTNAT